MDTLQLLFHSNQVYAQGSSLSVHRDLTKLGN
jgi:hypothetical protein